MIFVKNFGFWSYQSCVSQTECCTSENKQLFLE